MPSNAKYVSADVISALLHLLGTATKPLRTREISIAIARSKEHTREVIAATRRLHPAALTSVKLEDNEFAYMLAENRRWVDEILMQRTEKRKQARIASSRRAYQRRRGDAVPIIVRPPKAQKPKPEPKPKPPEDEMPVKQRWRATGEWQAGKIPAVRSVFDLGAA